MRESRDARAEEEYYADLDRYGDMARAPQSQAIESEFLEPWTSPVLGNIVKHA